MSGFAIKGVLHGGKLVLLLILVVLPLVACSSLDSNPNPIPNHPDKTEQTSQYWYNKQTELINQSKLTLFIVPQSHENYLIKKGQVDLPETRECQSNMPEVYRELQARGVEILVLEGLDSQWNKDFVSFPQPYAEEELKNSKTDRIRQSSGQFEVFGANTHDHGEIGYFMAKREGLKRQQLQRFTDIKENIDMGNHEQAVEIIDSPFNLVATDEVVRLTPWNAVRNFYRSVYAVHVAMAAAKVRGKNKAAIVMGHAHTDDFYAVQDMLNRNQYGSTQPFAFEIIEVSCLNRPSVTEQGERAIN